MQEAKVAQSNGDHKKAQEKAKTAQDIAKVAKKCAEGQKMVDGKCQ